MIALAGVSKSYGQGRSKRAVLSDLSALFDCSADVGILGANASGKSTLLRIIAGMELPDRGRVVRRVRVSFPLGHSGAFHPNLSAADNVRFVARLYGADTRRIVRFVREFSEIGARFEEPLSTYSNNMRARVTFATSIAFDFDVYIVDEITAVGDPAFKRKCMLAFEERRKTARVIMASQSANTIVRICKRGAVLEDGRLWVFPSMADAVAEYERVLPVSHA